MNISDEAVEAVASAIVAASKSDDSPFEGELYGDEARHLARAALEAAAPYLMAQAWDEGVDYVFEGGAEVSDENPYRSAGAGE